MNIAISGSSGLIGSALRAHWLKQGHIVTALKRWRHADAIDPVLLEGKDIVVHLAGAPISCHWTKINQALIRESRVGSTRALSEALSRVQQKPRLLITASAIGYYGSHRANVVIDEDAPMGEGFLPDLCRDWEAQTFLASQAGIRVVFLRTGLVLGAGGVLARILPIFNWGLGGVLGCGDQMMSWVALDEIPLIVDHLIQTPSLLGPVNVVAPRAVSNRDFTRILAEVIQRKALLPVPVWAIKLLWGSMGQTLLLEGADVRPRRLESSGYLFKYPDIRAVLQKLIIVNAQ